MSDYYIYRCPKCTVALLDPQEKSLARGFAIDSDTLGTSHIELKDIYVWCPVCKEWVEANMITSLAH